MQLISKIDMDPTDANAAMRGTGKIHALRTDDETRCGRSTDTIMLCRVERVGGDGFPKRGSKQICRVCAERVKSSRLGNGVALW